MIKDCAVVGVLGPKEEYEEAARAFVVKENQNLKEDDVIEFLEQNRSCVDWKLEAGVKFVEEIPRNHLGKVIRRLLGTLFDQC